MKRSIHIRHGSGLAPNHLYRCPDNSSHIVKNSAIQINRPVGLFCFFCFQSIHRNSGHKTKKQHEHTASNDLFFHYAKYKGF